MKVLEAESPSEELRPGVTPDLIAHIYSGDYPLPTMTCWIMLGNVASDGLGARSRIPFQRTHGSMPRAGEQNRRVGPILGGVGQRGMP